MTAFLPKVGEAMVENTGQPRPSYRRWMQQVTEAVNAPATPPGPDPEPPTPPISFVINGSGSVTADGSVAGGEFVIGLDNDQDEPGNTKFYGTDSAGNRGFVALSEGLEAGTGIALTDSGYTMLPSVATPADLPLTGNAGEAVRVTDEAPGVYAWDGAAFTLDSAADGKAGIVLDASLDDLNDVDAPTPADGQVITWEASSSSYKPKTPTGGVGMALVGSATVAGSAATTLTVSGLDLAADGAYLVLLNVGNATASSITLSMFYNGDTTQTNYYFQFWAAAGASSNASRTNVAAITSVNASTSAAGAIEILPDILSGYPRATVRLNRFAPASIELLHAAHIRNNGANVTSIAFSSSVANALAIGSYVKVYRLG